MDKKKIAINGFGRIGRLVLRQLLNDPNAEVVAINDLTVVPTLAHLFKYDSSQGTFDGTVSYDDQGLIINNKHIKTFASKNPAELPWADLGIDTVLECTGVFRDREKAGLHIQAGAKRVIVSAPGKGATTVVRGINDELLHSDEQIFSNASCTTNCLAPLVKVISDNWGIEQAYIGTVHAYTADQNLQDAPHKDLRRARAAAMNIVPTSTGAGDAIALIFPELKGKINASSLRVPVVTGSIVEMIIVLKNEANDVNAINTAFKSAAEGHFKGIMEYSEAPLVSTDIIGNPHSAIFDAGLTSLNGKLLKVTAWYDNESGYAARLAEVAVF
jgi:glyceraldehyde 3-phosphate dehydrogenase